MIGVKYGGDLTVNDSSEEGTGAIKAGNNAYAAVAMTIKNEFTEDANTWAKLTVNGGTLEGYYYGITGSGNKGRGNTEVTVNGGKIVGTATDDGAGIYNPQGKLSLKGGEVSGYTGVYVKSGVVSVVDGGKVTATGAKVAYKTTGDGFVSTGDAFVVDNCDYPGGTPNVAISGGTFVSAHGDAVASYAKEGKEANSKFISGGTFSSVLPAELCAKGFTPVTVADEDGMYTVTTEKVAKVGDVEYADLQEAINAAEGKTVTLLKDVDVTERILVDKQVTL